MPTHRREVLIVHLFVLSASVVTVSSNPFTRAAMKTVAEKIPCMVLSHLDIPFLIRLIDQ